MRNAKGRKSQAVCALVSGGVESAALISHMLLRQRVVYPLYVRSGHVWEKAELYWLKRLLRSFRAAHIKPLSILDLPVSDSYRKAKWSLSGRRVPSARTRDEAVYLPGRNILLLAKASVFCAQRGIPRVALGTLKSNPFPDASDHFFKRLASALSTGLGFHFGIEVPFGRIRKIDVLERADSIPWKFTFSCLAPKRLRHCGKCNKCAERKKAFRSAQMNDPTVYLA